jgi:hypothetical protein
MLFPDDDGVLDAKCEGFHERSPTDPDAIFFETTGTAHASL